MSKTKPKKGEDKFNKAKSVPEKTYEKGTVKNLYLNRPSSHGGWPEGPSKSFMSNKPVMKQISSWLKDMGLLEVILSRILSESIEYFGKGTVDFKNLVESESDPHVAAIKSGWTEIGKGLTRTVYAHPTNNSVVLKIANIDENLNLAKKTNVQEASNPMQRYGIFPKVYERDEEGLWILSERVRPIEDWESMKSFFPEVDITVSRFFLTLLLHMGMEHEKLGEEKFTEKIKEMEVSSSGKHMISSYNKISTNPLYAKLVSAMAEYDIEPVEIAPRNVGIVERDGHPEFVLLDVSVGLGPGESTIEF